MGLLPAHAPIISCDARTGCVPNGVREALHERGTRYARIAGPGQCTNESVTRLLLNHTFVMVDCEAEDRRSLQSVPSLSDLIQEAGSADPLDVCERIDSWLTGCRRQTPIYGAVLIGGKSRRMGRTKHLIQTADGCSWLEHLTSRLEPFVARQMVSGAGELVGESAHLERVDDLEGVEGPLAGIGALLRRFPYVSWLVSACDMPSITPGAIRWLLEQRDGSEIAVIPRNMETGKIEPLFAYYDYRCRSLVDDLLESGGRRISDLCGHPAIRRPEIPKDLASCWRNINYPDQL